MNVVLYTVTGTFILDAYAKPCHLKILPPKEHPIFLKRSREHERERGTFEKGG